MTSRREFVERAALSAVALAVPGPEGLRAALVGARPPRSSFLDLVRPPDLVIAQTASADQTLRRESAERWADDNGAVVSTSVRDNALHVTLHAPSIPIRRLYIRWRGDMSATQLIMGDAWERAYGDLEWRTWIPDRIMPWYFATRNGAFTHAYGVRTNPGSFCFWQIDEHGISLCADVRSGGVALQLGERTLDVCDVVCRAGQQGESAFAAIHAFCQQMCTKPRLPAQPVYGSNDWYWAYGNNSASSVRLDAQHVVELSPTGVNRPFVVVDDGWQPGRGEQKEGVGTWDRGNEKFPDMPGLVADIRRTGARAGIWIRPLQPTADAPDAWRLQRSRDVLDPTVPEVSQRIAADIQRIGEWGFDLIKHDYTTFDIFGRWGFQMNSAMTRDGWSFASGADRTTAEVVDDLYSTIRVAAGQRLVIGCNTVSHLSTGHFDICRIGDDTSGTDWSRTRKMGINSLAFRGAQHGAFYAADADCVGVTNSIPWALNAQWLHLLAGSGTTLFASLAPDALGQQQRRDLRAAFALAAAPRPFGEPLDWQRTVYPEHWLVARQEQTFDWLGPDGAGVPK